MKRFFLAMFVCFFVQESSAMQLLSSLAAMVTGVSSSPKAKLHHFTDLKKESVDRALYLAGMINGGKYDTAYQLVESLYDDELWRSDYYANLIVDSAVRAEHARLLSKILANSYLSEASTINCLEYAIDQNSLPMVKLACFHLYRNCCLFGRWNSKYVPRESQYKYWCQNTTEQIRIYVDTFWKGVDPANPEVRLLELKQIYTHRSLENHCQYGLFDGLIKGADASFPDEYGELFCKKREGLGTRFC